MQYFIKYKNYCLRAVCFVREETHAVTTLYKNFVFLYL